MPAFFPEKIRFDIAKEDIVSFFADNKQKVFRPKDIYNILKQNRKFWRIAENTTAKQFIEWMLAETGLKEQNFEFPSRTYIRYTWGAVPILALVASLRPESYFSHYTAVYLHNLTEQLPKTIYINYEQPPKQKKEGPLDQTAIDRAFQNKMRMTRNYASHGNYRIYMLNGKHTNRLGVSDFKIDEENMAQVTNIERALIDITVRPYYAGGVHEVLKAYKNAQGYISVNKLTAFLKQLDYKYPYHQAIGFYLERTGAYKESSIKLLNNFPKTNDFYLDYNMKETNYSKKWRLFYPKGF